ncbi:MAG: type II toxin-antitoxin system VapC family toxin [Blastocatellia bacterium]|nr:type II toxin-antitoxin system VapC family toxin [Blastocatellia bacterium]
MNLLLDTHTFLWFADEQQSANLPEPTKDLLIDGRNALFISPASVWEMAIKVSIGKLKLTEPATRLVEFHLANNSIRLLPVRLSHYSCIETLPLHHRDPFDRLLVSHALIDGLPIVSIDNAFDQYGIERVWLA